MHGVLLKLIFLVILPWLLVMVFYWSWKAERTGQSTFRYIIFQLRPFALIGAMIFASWFIVNRALPPIKTNDINKVNYLIQRAGNKEIKAWAYRRLILEEASDAARYFDYLDHISRYRNTEEELYNRSYQFMDSLANKDLPEKVLRAMAMGEVYRSHKVGNADAALIALDKIYDPQVRWMSYLRAIVQRNLEDTTGTMECYSTEIEQHGSSERVYNSWALLLVKRKENAALAELLAIPEVWQHISFSISSRYYITSGNYLGYVVTSVYWLAGVAEWSDILGALFVTLVWIFYLYRADVFERESLWHIAFVLLLSMLITPLTLLLGDMETVYLGLDKNGEFWNDFIFCVFSIGLREEIIKIIPFLLLLRFTKAVNEPFDYILYASVSALGFAFVENMIYFEPGKFNIIVGRALISTVSHMFDTSIIAYALVLNKYKWEGKYPNWLVFLGGLLVASLAHGFYDLWLINEWAKQYFLITFVFYVFSISAWFTFKSNALSNSDFFQRDADLQEGFLRRILVVGFSAAVCLEYIISGYHFGAEITNEYGLYAIYFEVLLIGFLALRLTQYELREGKWQWISFSFSASKERTASGETIKQDWTGWKVHIANYKYNETLKPYLPWKGELERFLTINHQSGWHLVKLDKPLPFGEVNKDYILVQQTNAGGEIVFEKQLMLIAYLIKDIESAKQGSPQPNSLVKLGWVILHREYEEQIKEGANLSSSA